MLRENNLGNAQLANELVQQMKVALGQTTMEEVLRETVL